LDKKEKKRDEASGPETKIRKRRRGMDSSEKKTLPREAQEKKQGIKGIRLPETIKRDIGY
jgi:hypothetical protein